MDMQNTRPFSFVTILAVIVTAALASCNIKQPQQYPFEEVSPVKQVGDSTIYGLACDGTTDSLLVFLPYAGGDPDTFDIFDAIMDHRVLGRPHIGDQLAVILKADTDTVASSLYRVADMVLNINRLQGQWSYMVTPTLRFHREPPRPFLRQKDTN